MCRNIIVCVISCLHRNTWVPILNKIWQNCTQCQATFNFFPSFCRLWASIENIGVDFISTQMRMKNKNKSNDAEAFKILDRTNQSVKTKKKKDLFEIKFCYTWLCMRSSDWTFFPQFNFFHRNNQNGSVLPLRHCCRRFGSLYACAHVYMCPFACIF